MGSYIQFTACRRANQRTSASRAIRLHTCMARRVRHTTNSSRLGCASPFLIGVVHAKSNRKDFPPDQTAVRSLYSHSDGWFSNSRPHDVDSFLRQAIRHVPYANPPTHFSCVSPPSVAAQLSTERSLLNAYANVLWNGWFYPQRYDVQQNSTHSEVFYPDQQLSGSAWHFE